MVGRRLAAAKLGAATGLATFLNGIKFVALPAALSPHELDVLAIGLLLAITTAQAVGEPIATHRVLYPGARRARLTGAAAAAIFLISAVVTPSMALGVFAPGFDSGPADRDAIRLFALSGLALLVVWAIAGRLQSHRDYSGLGYAAVAPNLGLVIGIILGSVSLIAASMLAVTMLSFAPLWRRAGRIQPDDEPRASGRRGLMELLWLSIATQLNLVFLRVATGDLPPGSVGAIYIAVGVAALPVLVVAGSAASVSLPDWRAGFWSRPLRDVAAVAMLAALLEILVVGVLVVLDSIQAVRDLVDPAIRTGLRASVPVIAMGVPVYAAAWYLRGIAIAGGKAVTVAGLAAFGALAVPASRLVGDELEYVAAGYALSPIPWLAGGLLIARRVASR